MFNKLHLVNHLFKDNCGLLQLGFSGLTIGSIIWQSCSTNKLAVQLSPILSPWFSSFNISLLFGHLSPTVHVLHEALAPFCGVIWSTTFKKCYMNKVYYSVQIVYHATVYDCLNRDIGSFIYLEGKMIFGVHKCITEIQTTDWNC